MTPEPNLPEFLERCDISKRIAIRSFVSALGKAVHALPPCDLREDLTKVLRKHDARWSKKKGDRDGKEILSETRS